jgi:hypothetical protein
MGNLVGYAHLINAMSLKAIEVKKPAFVQPVTRIDRINGALAVPQAVAPEAGDFLAHIIFVLKHEGVNLSILAQALPRIESRLLVEAITQSPSSGYLRKVCFLWEAYSGLLLDCTDKPRGPGFLLFDPERYITGLSFKWCPAQLVQSTKARKKRHRLLILRIKRSQRQTLFRSITEHHYTAPPYSTVTDLARLRGWSTSVPLSTAT